MEYEILNEILTITMGTLFDPVNSKPKIRTRDSNRSYTPTEVTERQSAGNKVSQKNEVVSKEPKKKLDDLLDYWVINEGPKLFQQSLQRLKLDLSRLSRKEMERMSYETLNNEKRKLKNELKNYDMIFKGTFKRLPMKNEKEPMRPLYMYYKTIKEILYKYTQGLKKSQENNNVKKEVNQNSNNIQNNNNTVNANNNKIQEVTKKLVELKKKREDLRVKFQKYHSDFVKNNNRKIKYAQDIAPIESEYAIYKSLKEEIAKLESYLV